MDSNSLDKTLNFILNTLPRTLAPWEATKTFRQKTLKILSKLKEKKNVKRQSLELHVAISRKNTIFDKKNYKKWRVNEKYENLQCGH